MADAARVFAKRIGAAQETTNHAAEIRLRAERKLGEILAKTPKAPAGRPKKIGSKREPISKPPTLAESGINKKTSSRAQQLAEVPPEEFEAALTHKGDLNPNRVIKDIREKNQRTARQEKRIEAADREMMRKLSGINVGAYICDSHAANPSSWFAWMDIYAGHIRDNYPFHYDNRWATITLTYQMYGADDGKLNHKPLPLDLWKQMIRFLAERGWNIYLWATVGKLADVKPHLDWLARYLP